MKHLGIRIEKGKIIVKKIVVVMLIAPLKKAKESLLNAYGVDNARSIVGVNEKKSQKQI